MNGEKRSQRSGQRANDALLVNERHVGCLRQGKRQIDKRSLYREILEILQEMLQESCVLVVVLLVARSHIRSVCSCALVVLEQQYGIHTRSYSVALKAYICMILCT